MSMNSATIIVQLVEQKAIDRHSLSLCFSSSSPSSSSQAGFLTLGGAENRYLRENFRFSPLVSTEGWYTVTIEKVTIGDVELEVDNRVYNEGKGAIVDSGTTDTYLPICTWKGSCWK